MIKPFFKPATTLLLGSCIFLVTSCSVNRRNVENASNLEYNIEAFAKDASRAPRLIKAMEQSAETFMEQKKPKAILQMYEEVYATLPTKAVPFEQITNHARIKSYILSSYTLVAKFYHLEARGLHFLEAIRTEYSTGDQKLFIPVLDQHIESLR